MFVINDDLSIYATRGDTVFFTVMAEDNGNTYFFEAGDVLRMKIFRKKDANTVVLEKLFPITARTDRFVILLTEEDTKFGDVISKPTDYWYEVELNPFTNPQTIIGYDEDGAKVFRLFPEGKDSEETVVDPEDIPVVDNELDMTSDRPVQNHAIARAIVNLEAACRVTKEETENTISRACGDIAVERARIDNLIVGANAGDAEITDIRIGADGETYGSAGTAVREQFRKLTSGNLLTNNPETQTYIASENVIETDIIAKIPAKQKLKLKYTSGSATIRENSVGYLGITNADTGEETAPYATLKLDEEIEIVAPFNISKFRLYVTEVIANGELAFDVESKGVFESLNEFEEAMAIATKSAPKLIGIIGDSYSAYRDWISADYLEWYSDDGNAQDNDVSDVKQMWWWKLCDETNRTLLRNSSFSGSTICNTGENGADSSATSFVTRVKKDFGVSKTLEIKPEEIFVFGGTNDTWVNAPVGNVKYSNWDENDLKSVLPAFCYMVDYIKRYNPGAKIYNIVNDMLSEEIKGGMASACEFYGITNVILTNISKDNAHPNIYGMEQIKNQIIAAIS